MSIEVSKDHFGNHPNFDLAFEMSNFNMDASCFCFILSFCHLTFTNFLDNLSKTQDTVLASDCSGPKFHGSAKLLLFSTNFTDLISVRIAIGSGTAFLVAQLLDVQIFDQLRKKQWFIAPLTSSLIGSTIDTFLFFSISFYGTGIPWVTLSLGDLAVKILVALIMLIPFRLLLGTIKAVKV